MQIKVEKSLVVALYLNLIDFLYLKSQHEIKIEPIFFINIPFWSYCEYKKKNVLATFNQN